MYEWLREYFAILIGVGAWGVIVLTLLIDCFVYPILDDPKKEKVR